MQVCESAWLREERPPHPSVGGQTDLAGELIVGSAVRLKERCVVNLQLGKHLSHLVRNKQVNKQGSDRQAH